MIKNNASLLYLGTSGLWMIAPNKTSLTIIIIIIIINIIIIIPLTLFSLNLQLTSIA